MKTSRPTILTRFIAPTILATTIALLPANSGGQSCCGSGGGGGIALSLGEGPRVLQLHLKAPPLPKRLLVADITNRRILYNKVVAHGAGQTQISVRLRVPKNAIIKTRYIETFELNTVTDGPGAWLPEAYTYLITSAGTMQTMSTGGGAGGGRSLTPTSDNSSLPSGTASDTSSGSSSGDEECDDPSSTEPDPYVVPPSGDTGSYDPGTGGQPTSDSDGSGSAGETSGESAGDEPGDGETGCGEPDDYDPTADNDYSDDGAGGSGAGGDGGDPETEGNVNVGSGDFGGVNIKMSLGAIRKKKFGNLSLGLSKLGPGDSTLTPAVLSSFDWHLLKGSYVFDEWPSQAMYINALGVSLPMTRCTGMVGYDKIIPTAGGIAAIKNLPASANAAGYAVDFSRVYGRLLSDGSAQVAVALTNPTATWLFGCPDTTSLDTIPTTVTEGGMVRSPKLRVVKGKFQFGHSRESEVIEYYQETVSKAWVMSRSRLSGPSAAVGTVSGYMNPRMSSFVDLSSFNAADYNVRVANPALLTSASDAVIATGKYEVVTKWAETTGGRRTRYTSTATRADSLSPWKSHISVISVGPESGAPTPQALEASIAAAFPGSTSSVVVIGNVPNGHFRWTTKGWVKHIMVGSEAAPAYKRVVLKPYGNQPSPINSTVNNSDATITDYATLDRYSSTVVERQLAGNRVSYVVNAKSGNITDASGIQVDIHTTVRQTGTGQWLFSSRKVHAAGRPLAGRPLEEVAPDGTVTTYWYDFGTWDATTYTFSTGIQESVRLTPEDGAMRVTRASTGGDGVVHVSIFNDERRLVREERIKNATLIDATIHERDSVGNVIFKYREDGTDPTNWRTIYSATFDQYADGTPNTTKLTETDATGLTMTFWGGASQPTTIIRSALPAVGASPAIPQLFTTFAYDGNGRRTQEDRKTEANGTVLSSRSWKYNTNGELVLEKVDGLVTQYAYETLTDGRRVERRYGPGGAAQNETVNLTTLTPSATTTYLADGRLESITGPAVIAETYSYTVGTDGLRTTEVVRGSGTAAAPTAETSISRTRTDWVGRRIAELIQTPGSLNHWRTFEYDGLGHMAAEKVDGVLKRSYAYPSDGMLTVATQAAPDPDRSDSRLQALSLVNGVWWQSTSTDRGVSKRKVTGLTGSVLAYSESTDAEGRKSTVTETLESAGTILTTRTMDGVSNAMLSRRRAGVTVWENSFSVPEPVITTVDALGRPIYVNHTGMQVGTTITYDPTTKQVATVTTASTAVAGSATQAEVRTYYPATTASVGEFPYRLVNRNVNNHPTGQQTFYTPRGEVLAEYGAAYPVRYTYDAVGRMKKMETYQTHPGSTISMWPAGNPTTWVYHAGTDLLQTKLDAANLGPVYAYDNEGRMNNRTWARGVQTVYHYNNAGELRVIDYADSTPDVTVTRNDKGRIATVQDGTGFKAYGFGAGGGVESETQFDAAWNEVASLNYVKDSVGRRSGYGYWDAVSGVWTTWQGWSHEAESGRVDGVGTAWGWFDYSYKPGSDWLWKTTHDLNGTIETKRTPDELWRLSSIETSKDGSLLSPLAKHTYAYNARHERWKATQGDGAFWQYSYDELGQVTGGDKHLADATAFPGYDFNYEYDSIGNRTKAWTNGRRRDYISNTRNQYTNQREMIATGTPNNGPSKADVIGRAGAAAAGVNVNGVAATMTPLPGVTANGTPQSSLAQKAFHGLVTSSSGTAYTRGGYTSITVEELNPPAAPTGVTGSAYVPPGYVINGRTLYDEDGNMTWDDRFQYIWDAENRLIEVRARSWNTTLTPSPVNQPRERTLHTYDAYWRLVKTRVEEKSSATAAPVTKSVDLFAYSEGSNIIAEWSGEGVNRRVVRTNQWGLDLSGTFQGAGGVGGLLQSITGTGFAATSARAIEHPFYDGNGNIMGTFNNIGWGPMPNQLLAEHEYDPFGRRIRTTGPSPTLPYRFSTKREDARTGLNYYGFRWYQAVTGRWISRDPIGEAGGGNIYGFVINNPIKLVDLFGLKDEKPERKFENCVKVTAKLDLGAKLKKADKFLKGANKFLKKIPNSPKIDITVEGTGERTGWDCMECCSDGSKKSVFFDDYTATLSIKGSAVLGWNDDTWLASYWLGGKFELAGSIDINESGVESGGCPGIDSPGYCGTLSTTFTASGGGEVKIMFDTVTLFRATIDGQGKLSGGKVCFNKDDTFKDAEWGEFSGSISITGCMGSVCGTKYLVGGKD